MADDSEAAKRLDRAQNAGQELWQRLLGLEGVASGAGATRLLFAGFEGTHPPASTVSTWFGVKRFSVPGRNSAAATYLLSRVGQLLDEEAATELKRLWDEVPKLRIDGQRAAGSRSARPPDYLDSPSTVRRKDLQYGVLRLLDGEPGKVEELDISARFHMGSVRTGSEVPRYVERTADDALRQRFELALGADPTEWQDRIILASGPPAAGKTRSVLEALIDIVPEALALVKHPDTSSGIGDLAVALLAAQREEMFDDPVVVVFVEDLHLLTGQGSNLAEEIRRLLEGPRVNDQRLLLVGTFQDYHLAESDRHPRKSGFGVGERELLASASTYYSDEFDPSEEFVADEMFPDFRKRTDIGDTGLHRLPACMAAVDLLMGRIDDLKGNPELYINDSLVQAALDVAALDRQGGSYSLLRDLTDRWIRRRHPTRLRPDEAEFRAAFSWATTGIGPWAILNPLHGESPDEDRWRLLDALSDQLLDEHIPGEWVEAIADQPQLVQLAWSHFYAGREDAARRIMTSVAQTGYAYAMYSLADLLREFSEEGEATMWTIRAAEAGLLIAMYDAGRLLRIAGDFEGAERWFLEAFEGGEENAMVELALMHKAQGDLVGAARSYEQAGLPSDAGKMYFESGLLPEAERCFRQGASSGDAVAVNALGFVLMEMGNFGEAERLFRNGVERGDVVSMVGLGMLFSKQGRFVEGEAWSRRAAEAGNPVGMSELAVALEHRGQPDEAMEWYRRAAAAIGFRESTP